jgi:hypothetical protein
MTIRSSAFDSQETKHASCVPVVHQNSGNRLHPVNSVPQATKNKKISLLKRFFVRKSLNPKVTPEPDFLKPVASETVNQIIAGMLPSPIASSKKSIRDLGNLSKSFKVKMAAGIMECEEEIEQGIEQGSKQAMQHSLSESLATCLEKDPAKGGSSKPRKSHVGLKDDDVQVFSCTMGVTNHMTVDWSADVKASLYSAIDEICKSFSCAVSGPGVIMLGESEDLVANVDHAKFPAGLAECGAAFAISEMVYELNEEERNIIVDGGEYCANLQAGHIAVDALNESGRKAEVSTCRLIHSIPSDNCTDLCANSQFGLLEVEGTPKYVDSDDVSNFSDFIITDRNCDHEKEKKRVANSTESPFAKDVQSHDIGPGHGICQSNE